LFQPDGILVHPVLQEVLDRGRSEAGRRDFSGPKRKRYHRGTRSE